MTEEHSQDQWPPSGEGSHPPAPRRGDTSISEGRAATGFIAPDEQQTVISKRPPVSEPRFRQAAGHLEIGKSLEGDRLGHFQLEEFVGGGGMGAVFRAIDTMLGRTVAVKVVSGDTTDEETLRRFKNEAQSAARLDHPNIARVYYVGEDQGWNYIVFEFIEGVNIRDLVDQKGPLPLDEAISYVLQVAEALQHASQRDVVHRDIKPSNVLIMPDGRVKLVDMGLARLHQVESSSADLTASGVTLGTFDYISPEQARDPRSADVRSDLYSLGCTFYFMLTGFPPFPEGTVLQKLLSHSSETPPDVRLYRPELPEGVTTILNRLLAKIPNQRYQEPAELIGQLLMLAEQLGLSTISRGGTVWITSRHTEVSLLERHLPWFAPLALLACIVMLLHTMGPSAAELEAPAISNVASTFIEAGSNDAGDSRAGAMNGAAVGGSVAAGDSDGKGSGQASDDSPGALPLSPSTPDPTTVPPPVPALELDGAPQKVTDVSSTPSTASASDDALPKTALVNAENVIVVSPTPAALPADARVVRTLSDAFQEAAIRPEIDTIELRFNSIEEYSFEIQGNSKLTVRPADGYSPVVRFQLSDEEFMATTQPAMIQLTKGSVRWDRIQFQLDLPPYPYDSSALFHLADGASLQLFHCTMTIRDAHGAHDEVAFVELAEPEQPNMMGIGIDQDGPTEPYQVDFEGCVARGQASLLRAPEAVPYRFSWDHGLLVTDRNVFEMGGATTKPQWPDPRRMDIELRNVTVRTPQNVCHTSLTASAPYLLELYPRWENCIFLMEPSMALVRYEGIDEAERALSGFKIQGEDNYYEDTSVLLQIEPAGIEFRFADDELLTESWYDEVGEQPGSVLDWEQSLPVDVPADRHTKNHYLLTPTESMIEQPGFDPSRLPNYLELLPKLD